ncbi:MAG: EAL domain-containing protein [Sulfuricurvum sp.]|uniref:two-component system response regulator n=1 Tax=Sulfuricurvum sp. TaxID=2025608 RepID=UPI0025FAAF7B|nr:EAL domain-containing protein [Sulfuricurvum sp.]MCK9372026.1 EAL domain-containing protein [Sulfuricurvum sp.]
MGERYSLIEQTKKLTLLFVEDDSASREALSQVFALFFQETQTASDGQEGWERYQKQKFDLVITDIDMPRMDGIQLTEKIKADNCIQKIIIFSAYDTGEYLVKAIRMGIDGFIMKPVELEQLMDTLQKVTRTLHSEQLITNYYQSLEHEIYLKTTELRQLAITDPLTGLYNRNKFNALIEEEEDKIILLLNIDNFDNINMSYGYYNGDMILKKIADFFQQNSPDSAVLFRLGHDEFVYIFYSFSVEEVETFAESLKEKIGSFPIEHEHISVRFTATISIAEGKGDFLKNAHIALKEARQLGKNRIHKYQPDSYFENYQKEIQRHVPILFEAINKDLLIPYYQPIVNNRTYNIEKYEVLARLIYNGEILSPFYFIKAAELTGMLPSVTRSMIEKSFDFFKDNLFSFSINIGEQDLNDNYLSDFLLTTAQRYRINPDRIVLEVLEGISAHATDQNLNQLKELKRYGFQLAIDDFGAQNSNFERVHRLNVDFIKIDGSFIKEIDKNENSYKIAKNITQFAKSIGAKVIAEFVHNQSIHEKVMELDIDYSQGYFLGEPKCTL